MGIKGGGDMKTIVITPQKIESKGGDSADSLSMQDSIELKVAEGALRRLDLRRPESSKGL